MTLAEAAGWPGTAVPRFLSNLQQSDIVDLKMRKNGFGEGRIQGY